MRIVALFFASFFFLNPLNALSGRISDDRYYSSTGPFSFKNPQMMEGVKITDLKPADNRYQVSFIDNWGNLLNVEVLIQDATHDPKQLFYNEIYQPLLTKFPSLKLVVENEEYLSPIGESYFALVDTSQDDRLDSKRLYLVSFLDNHAIIISTQEAPLSNFSRKLTGSELAANLNPMVEKLLETRLSYQKKR